MPAPSYWREDAINWIHHHQDNIPENPEHPWQVSRPSRWARQNALRILRFVPIDFIPVELAVTLDRGIELEWLNGPRELTIEVLSNGSLEILKCVDGAAIEEKRLEVPDWRLGNVFNWIKPL
jgi:hypothetical protein